MRDKSRCRASSRRRWARSGISLRATWRIAMLAFVVLFKFTDALAGAMTAPFVIDLGFSRNEYAGDRQGRRLCRDAARRICRRLHGARASAGHQPVDRRHPAGGRQPGVLLAGGGRHEHAWLSHSPSRSENFTSAIGTVIFVAYLSALCQQPAAHRDAIRAADRARRGRPHLFVVGAGFIAAATGWAWFFVDLRARPGCRACLLLAWLQRAGISRRWRSRQQPVTRTTCAA